ncbi:MAG: hypothetical protein AVDCRST_MAG01-01-1900 [uncultured Rubrobacteraceae bacterium]|uniref:Uncharacterized protein n=1 Tax=uncultured Rubrobacteraceae bacterium TaxID=349277 RepID=A0A6J4PK40_9ACTN|nr:MAG: hypothetical protein AVDCRST_MAG01-01-1900 [uncultured Rubrobacteraceae bacterium]
MKGPGGQRRHLRGRGKRLGERRWRKRRQDGWGGSTVGGDGEVDTVDCGPGIDAVKKSPAG